MLTIGYVRVSTDRQAEKGVSLEAQEAKIRAMATVQGSELIDVVVDGGESAKSLNRPGLQRLMGLVNGGKVQAVIVAKLDRLTRSVKDLCGLLELFEKRKVALISVAEALDTGSAAGRLIITIMGAVSQWEREAIGERTRDAMRHKRSNGERVGNIEFGYRLSADMRHLELDPTEQTALGLIRELRRQGHTLRGVAAILNSRGLRTRRGTEWRLESVARVVKQSTLSPLAKIAEAPWSHYSGSAFRGRAVIRTDAKTAAFALVEHKEPTNMKPKNTICLWFGTDAHEAARFYAATFPDSKVTAVHEAPGDYPDGKKGDVLTVEFTVVGIPCIGLNDDPRSGTPRLLPSRSRQRIREETDRYWNAIVGNSGAEMACARTGVGVTNSFLSRLFRNAEQRSSSEKC